jgi:hypothetical protein
VAAAAAIGLIWFVGQLLFWDDVSTSEAPRLPATIFIVFLVASVVFEMVAARRKRQFCR